MISLFLVMTMLLSVALTGCGGQTQGANSNSGKDPEPFKIGFPFSTATNVPVIKAINGGVEAAVKAAGGELVIDNAELSPDGQVTSVQKLISMGVDGILIIPMADSILPKINKMCSDAKIPFAISFRSINDPAIKAEIEASPYYVGNCYEDEADTAYQVMTQMADIGVKNVALLGINKGDTTGDARDKGIAQAASEKGVKILTEARGITQATDVTKAVESVIAAYPEMDGLILVGTTAVGDLDAAEKALKDHGKAGKVKVAKIDFTSGMETYLASGELNVIVGGHQVIDPTFACAMLVNKVIGTPISDKPVSLKIKMTYVTTAEDAINYMKYVEGDVPPYTSDDIKNSLIKFYNQDVNTDTFTKAIADFTVADVVERHKDLVK